MVETHSAFVAEAFSHALPLREPSGRWELGFQGFSLCAWGRARTLAHAYRKWPAQWLPSSGRGLCHTLAGGSLASGLESEMRSHQLCSLETGKSWQVAFPGAFVFV